jgi:hypothetical protein
MGKTLVVVTSEGLGPGDEDLGQRLMLHDDIRESSLRDAKLDRPAQRETRNPRDSFLQLCPS